jgi:hypothetical protein
MLPGRSNDDANELDKSSNGGSPAQCGMGGGVGAPGLPPSARTQWGQRRICVELLRIVETLKGDARAVFGELSHGGPGQSGAGGAGLVVSRLKGSNSASVAACLAAADP